MIRIQITVCTGYVPTGISNILCCNVEKWIGELDTFQASDVFTFHQLDGLCCKSNKSFYVP